MDTNNTIAGLLADLRTLDGSMAASLEAMKIAIDRINMRIHILDEQLRIEHQSTMAALHPISVRFDALEKAIQGATDTSLHAARQVDGVSKRMDLHAGMFDALNNRIADLEAVLSALNTPTGYQHAGIRVIKCDTCDGSGLIREMPREDEDHAT